MTGWPAWEKKDGGDGGEKEEHGESRSSIVTAYMVTEPEVPACGCAALLACSSIQAYRLLLL
jgi:hypothetical protein